MISSFWRGESAAARPKTNIGPLTSVRALFSLLVVWTHFCGYHGIDHWTSELGQIAVGWFFILSGFILAYNFPALPSAKDKCVFLISRFWRLWPVQIVTIFCSLWLFPSGWYIVKHQTWWFVQSLTLTHSWTAVPYASQLFNVPAWSISDEWFFYLLFPLLICGKWPIRLAIAFVSTAIPLAWATAHGCWDGIAAFSFAGDSYHPTCDTIMMYWPLARLWEFILGIALCEIASVMSHAAANRKMQIVFMSIALVLFCAYRALSLIKWGYTFWFFSSWLFSAACGAMLILSLSMRGPLTKWLSVGPLVFAGEISFSVYMTHMLILRFADDHKIGYSLPLLVQFIGIYAVVCLMATLMFMLVERPSRAGMKAILRSHQAALREMSLQPKSASCAAD